MFLHRKNGQQMKTISFLNEVNGTSLLFSVQITIQSTTEVRHTVFLRKTLSASPTSKPQKPL